MAFASCKVGLNWIDRILSVKLIHSYLFNIMHQSQPTTTNSKVDLDTPDELTICSLLGTGHHTARHYVPTRAFSGDVRRRQAEIENGIWNGKLPSRELDRIKDCEAIVTISSVSGTVVDGDFCKVRGCGDWDKKNGSELGWCTSGCQWVGKWENNQHKYKLYMRYEGSPMNGLVCPSW